MDKTIKGDKSPYSRLYLIHNIENAIKNVLIINEQTSDILVVCDGSVCMTVSPL